MPHHRQTIFMHLLCDTQAPSVAPQGDGGVRAARAALLIATQKWGGCHKGGKKWGWGGSASKDPQISRRHPPPHVPPTPCTRHPMYPPPHVPATPCTFPPPL